MFPVLRLGPAQHTGPRCGLQQFGELRVVGKVRVSLYQGAAPGPLGPALGLGSDESFLLGLFLLF